MFNQIDPINLFTAIRNAEKEPAQVERIMNYLNQIHEPMFHAKEVGLSSKLINDWIKAGIIDEGKEDNKDQWRKFSLVEGVWLKFVEELRFFGVGLNEIKGYKKRLFDIDMERIQEMRAFYLANRDQNEDYKLFSYGFEEIFTNGDEEALKILQKINPTSFALALFVVLLHRENIVFVFNQQMYAYLDLSGGIAKEFPDEHAGLDELNEHLISHSFAMINFKSLLTRFFDNEKVEPNEDFYFGIMSKKEKELLDRIKSDDYSKITVTLQSGQIVLTRATKKNNDKLMKQLARLMKKGDFLHVEFITRDGSIVKYDETEIIK
jgi:hypothetical protein